VHPLLSSRLENRATRGSRVATARHTTSLQPNKKEKKQNTHPADVTPLLFRDGNMPPHVHAAGFYARAAADASARGRGAAATAVAAAADSFVVAHVPDGDDSLLALLLGPADELFRSLASAAQNACYAFYVLCHIAPLFLVLRGAVLCWLESRGGGRLAATFVTARSTALRPWAQGDDSGAADAHRQPLVCSLADHGIASRSRAFSVKLWGARIPDHLSYLDPAVAPRRISPRRCAVPFVRGTPSVPGDVQPAASLLDIRFTHRRCDTSFELLI
jgi:hypothetical protein